MKPGFALNLSLDGIGLLHRVADGWADLGRADFDDPEFETRLAGLRARAAGLAPDGIATKLILPASQILYCEVDAPGPDRASRRAQIAAALEGRTPYAVDDLVFDWSRQGREVQVAVVAKLTLDEAEAFAQTHGFNPVSFVAIPDATQFAGEPFFGTTRNAGRLPAGEQLIRDQDPVRIVAVAPPQTGPQTGPATTASGTGAAPAEPTEIEPPLAETGEVGSENAQKSNNQTPIPEAPTAPPHTPEPAATLAEDFEAPFIALDDIPDPDPVEVPAGLAPAFSSRRPSQPAPAERTASLDIGTDDAPGLVGSRLHLVADPVALSAVPSLGPAVEIEEAGITAPVLKIPQGQETGEDAPAGGKRRPRSGLGRALLNTLPEARHGTQAQQRARRSGDAGTADAGIFGAPRPARSVPPARMRLGLILVAVLLLVMSAIALWSVWFAADPAPSAAAPAEAAETAALADKASPAAEPPAEAVAVANPLAAEPETAPPATSADPAAAATAVATGSLPEAVVGHQLPDPLPGPLPDPPPDPGPAAPDPATLWDAAPATATGPEADASGAPAVAAAAPGPATPDSAITPLPAPDAFAADDQPQKQPLPPPYGTEIAFGPDGLIRATPDGVVTPGGFTLISGRPPVAPAPAPRPDPAAAATPEAAPESGPESTSEDQSGAAAPPTDAAVAEALAAPPDPVDPAHAAKKPRARPAAVAQRAEAARAEAAAIAAAAEAAARAEAEALASATARAVASSRRPVERPSRLAKAVEAAVSDAVTAAVTEAVAAPAPAPAHAPAPAAATQPEEIDEPEPVQSAPNLPTTVTVAKQATVANAIDLGKINLIGVYGSSASRRALVRMPTGRLIKVKIGDRIDGGKVAAIGDSELTYVKNGRSYTLKIVGNG